MPLGCFKRPAVTAPPSTAVKYGIWQVEQEYVVRHLSAMKKPLLLNLVILGKEHWRVELLPSDNQTVPGIYLVGEAGMPSLIINFAVTVVHPRNPGKSILCEYVHTFHEEESSRSFGWRNPVAESSVPGVVLDDSLLLHVRLRNSQDLATNSLQVDRPLLTESKEFVTRAYMRVLSGPSAPEPDVTLKMEDGMLPAHRSLLAESSDYFKAIFQTRGSETKKDVVGIQKVAAPDMKVILQFMNGELETLPEERLQSLIIATHRLQLKQLMERCVSRLKVCLTLDTFAETAVLADRVKHQGLHQACIDFAMLEQNRSALQAGEQEVLKRVMAEAPDLALKLMGEALKQGVPNDAQKE